MSREAVVRLDGVTKRFDDFTALDRLSLEIRRGEFLTLLGASGSGKTTTLRLISGFEQPSDGAVYMNDELLNTVPAHRRRVNTVFQNYALFPHMTVGQNVEYGLRFDGVGRGERRRRARAMLERVGLPEKIDQKPDALSGGQMQRVALARALIKEPEVLLLDEPLSALDAKLRKEMQLELKRTQRETGLTFVYVTHDQEEALVMSDRIAVLDRGRVVQLGTPGEVFERPRSLFVAEFTGSSNRLEGRVVRVGDGEVVVEVGGAGWLTASAGEDSPLREGDCVCLVARPQYLRIGQPEASGNNAIEAVLEDVIYLGVDRRLVLRVAGDRRIELHERGDRLPADLEERVGRSMEIEFPAGKLWAYRGEAR